MKKLGKIQLQNALVLEEQEMKRIYGGSGSNVSCMTSCGSGFTTVGPDYFDSYGEWETYLGEMHEILCGSAGSVTCN